MKGWGWFIAIIMFVFFSPFKPCDENFTFIFTCGISLLKWMRQNLSLYHLDVDTYSARTPSATILVFQHLDTNTILSVYQICMAKNLYVRIWEYTELSKEKIHISAHLDNLMHVQVFICEPETVVDFYVLVSICCVDLLLCWCVKIRGRQKGIYLDTPLSLYSTLYTFYCVTLTWGFFPFLSQYVKFHLVWLHFDVSKLSNNRKQLSQGSTEETKGKVTLWVISTLFMNSAQSRVALNSLINWLFKRNTVTFLFFS